MRTIWKYELPIGDVAGEIEMPLGARIIHVDQQRSMVATMWAEIPVPPGVPPSELATERRAFVVVGTGHTIPGDGLTHVGTVLDGPFVWHLYEETSR